MKRRTGIAIALAAILTYPAFGAMRSDDAADRAAERASRHMILHAPAPLTDAERADLASRGILVQGPLTGDRYIARVAEDARVAGAPVTLEPFTAAKKIHPSAFAAAAHAGVWASVNVLFHDDVTFDDARTAIAAAGGALDDPLETSFLPSHRVAAKIAPASLDALAADDRVELVTGPAKFRLRTDNTETALLSHVTDIQQAPYGLTGNGVAVSLFELAQGQSTHVEFGGRFTVFATGGTADDKKHATHVAGTIGAAGVRPDAKGMAPNASIYEFCIAYSGNTCHGDWLTDKDQKLAPLGVVADNNSWGYTLGWSYENGMWVWVDAAQYYGAYDPTTTEPLDEITIRRNVLFVHSAGNDGHPPALSGYGQHLHVDQDGNTVTGVTWCFSQDGSGKDCPAGCTGGCETARHHTIAPYDTMNVTAAAKNVIAVGNVDALARIASDSSLGPAKDGRVKPDVVARGTDVLSSIPTNSYAYASGTSMSSPVVTGVAALLTEQWRRTFGNTPTPAQLKALIIAGAQDLGNAGPDYKYGFGLVNAKSSADFILADGGSGARIRTLNVAQGQQIEVPVVVDTPQTLRVVLDWSDPGVTLLGDDPFSAPALVNDLDVKVVDPKGVEYLPYVLDKTHPDAVATRGVNTLDNVEMVEIPNAVPGGYRVIVRGTNLKQGPQQAVLVSSTRAARECTDVQEPNDSAATAYAGLVPNQTVTAGFCTPGDVDYYRFTVTKKGAVSVSITAGDTPLRLTLSSSAVNGSVEVPANTTQTLTTASVNTVPLDVTLKVEATATPGVEPVYAFTPVFGQTTGSRRRSVR